MAQVLARVFPAQQEFVRKVSEGLDRNFESGPYRGDKIIRQTDQLVEFQTPPRSEGLDTTDRLKANEDPIDGVAIFKPPALNRLPELLILRLRLPSQLRGLAPIIIRELESEMPAK